MKTLPACYFPTTIVFVDDQPSFFAGTEIKLNPEIALHTYYQSSEEAVNYFQQHYSFDFFTNRCMFRLEDTDFDQRNIEFKLFHIHQEIYNAQRFQQVSTIVIDFDMPSVNGLQACERINTPHVQKILLTGAGSEKMAIQAFNEGLIQGYLHKQDTNMYAKLNEVIQTAQYRYFKELSRPVRESIAPNAAKTWALNDPAFIEFFQDVVRKHSIVEYYLLDDQGSFLMVDKGGKYHGIYVYGADKMEGFKQIVRDSAGIPKKVVDRVQKSPHVLCYHHAQEHFLDEKQWEKALYPEQVVDGNDHTYYIAIVPDIFDLNCEKACTFANLWHK